MTRDKEVWKVMTKFDYEILMLLCNQNVDNPLKAMNNFTDIRRDTSSEKKII